MSASKFFIKSLLKSLRQRKRTSGFTLLELLIALILTFLIITPLMSLVISFMNNDRQEQAKNSSQQEIQAALDYMAQDLQQAVYIYDAAALSKTNNTTNPEDSGIQNQIPPFNGNAVPNCTDSASCVPVLAFWKRKYFDRADTVKDPANGNLVIIKDIDDPSEGSDRYVYSLVVYYLIKNAPSSSTWSPINRIGRFELNGGIIDNPELLTYKLNPDKGFALFDVSASPGNIRQSMNVWKKATAPYDPNGSGVVTLVDYIDNTPVSDFIAAGVTASLEPPPNDESDATDNLISRACGQRTGETIDAVTGTVVRGSSRVPPDDIDTLQTGSFYACVNPVNDQGQSVVQVFLRGNALPRLSNNPLTWQVGSSNKETQVVNRPVASVRVAVRGLLNEQTE
jgi:type II secretory pathway pseudopilin PulG